MLKRSKHYDWFKGQNNHKDPKENFKIKSKIIWKFTKIFLYFSLFFFSMWGCVQVFTHKVDTRPAFGITFSDGDKNLSPQYKKIKVKTIMNNGIEEMYFDKTKPDYIDVNYENGAGSQLIKNVNTQLKNELGISSPTKARKGGNYVISLQNGAGKYIGKNKNGIFIINNSVDKSKERILLYTTAKIHSSKYKSYNSEIISQIPNILQDLSSTLKIKRYSIFKNKDKKYEIKNTYTTDLNLDISTLSDNDKLAFYFNLQVLAAIYTNFDSNVFNDVFQYNKGKQFTNIDNVKKVIEREKKIDFFLNIIRSNKNSGSNKIQISSNPVGFTRNTNWVPITNWALAWSKDGGTGPFYGVFVFPIAYMTNKIIDSLPLMDGWESLITIILVVVTLSILMFALNFKNILQQTKMQELAAKKAIIDAKYAPYKGNKQMENRQRQEVAALYKKEGISPIAQVGSLFLRMPFFLAMWRVIGSIDHIKATEWMGINFATTSWRALLGNLSQWNNGWAYFPIISIAVCSQLFSTLLPKFLTKRRNKNRMNVQQKEAMKKSDRTQKIMMVVTLFFPLITSAGVQMYFIIRSLWTILEQLITHKLLIYKKQKNITYKIK